jgi:hypothetical protein
MTSRKGVLALRMESIRPPALMTLIIQRGRVIVSIPIAADDNDDDIKEGEEEEDGIGKGFL